MIDRHAEHRQCLLKEHLSDWEKALNAKGNTAKHATEQAKRVRHIFDGCRFKFWQDISASKVQVRIADMRKAPVGSSAETALVRVDTKAAAVDKALANFSSGKAAGLQGNRTDNSAGREHGTAAANRVSLKANGVGSNQGSSQLT